MKWKELEFKEFVTLQRGFDLPQALMQEGEVPVLGSNCIIGYHNQAKVQPPGVVTGRSGTLGVVQYIDVPYWPHNTALWVRDFKQNAPRFVYYKLQTLNIDGFSSGASVPTLNRNNLDNLKVTIPSVDLQCRIASVLSSYDDLIENNLRRIKLLEESARMLYKEWFVRLRFPGYEHTRNIKGMPEGWEKKKIEHVAVVNQSSLNNSFDGEIEYVDIASVTTGQINETTAYEFRDAPSRARRIVKHGDIIWSCVRPNRKSHAIIWKPLENLIVSTGFAVLTPLTVPTSYLYYFTTTDEFVGYLHNRAGGVAYPAVKSSDFEDANILIPPETLLKEFNEFVTPIIDQMHELRSMNYKLRQARDILLPKLMSGEIEIESF